MVRLNDNQSAFVYPVCKCNTAFLLIDMRCMQWITQYQYMKSPTENPVDAKVAEVPAEQPKKPSKSSSRQKLIPIEDLDPDAPRSVFQERNWNKELKQH